MRSRHLAIVAVAGLCASAEAQLIVWNGGNGLWNTAANWTPANVPNIVGETARIDAAGVYQVDFNTIATCDLELLNPDASIEILIGQTFTIAAGIPAINNGLIQLAGNAGSSADSVLRWNAAGTVTGTGAIQLEENLDCILTSIAAAMITNDVGHTIHGTGTILAPIDNDGLISANFTGQVLDLGAPMINDGEINATNGGTLDINSTSNITQSATAKLRADGGTVRFNGNHTIIGGIMESENGGVFTRETGGPTTLDEVDFQQGEIQIELGGILAVNAGGIINDGLIRCLGNAGSSADSTFRVDESFLLDGSGELRLEENLDAVILGLGGAVLTQAATHSIRGAGTILVPIDNNGLIEANVLGQTLDFSRDVTNNGTIRATNGSVIEVNNGANITQSGAGVLEADNSTIRFLLLQDVEFGTVRSLGTGVFTFESGAISTWRDVHFSEGEAQVELGGILDIDGGGLENDALIRCLGNAGSSTNTSFRFVSTGDLSGGGELRLEENLDAVFTSSPGVTITQQASHSVKGTGTITVEHLINEGLISANVPGATMDLSGDITNHSLIEVLAGSLLEQNAACDITQPGSGVLLAAGGEWRFVAGPSVTGGTIDAIAGGFFSIPSASLTDLVDITFASGELRVQLGGVAIIGGAGITNHGLIRCLGNTGTSTNSQITANTPCTFGGTGEVRLEEANDTLIVPSNAAEAVTNGPDHTIAGVGTVTAALVNQGTLSPGLSTGTLTVNGELTLAPTSILDIELGGTGAGLFDSIPGTQPKHLGGTLLVSYFGGYTPVKFDSFDVVSSTISVDGTFAQVIAPTPPPTLRWAVQYQPDRATLRLVCEADCEVDGDLDVFDFLCFQGLYGTQQPYADCEKDGDWDVFDFLCFQSQYASCL